MSDIKIINEPSAYLVGRQDTNDAEIDRFLADHQVETWLTDTEVAGEKLAEIAGRTCYMSFAKPRPGGNQAYINHILESSHGSIFEHAVWNFVFTGVSRSLTHELIRHRAGFGYCLAGDTQVYSGSKVNGKFDGVSKRWTLDKLYRWSQDPARKGRLRLITIRCFNGEEFVQAGIRGIAATGVKPLFRVTLNDGKSIRCSADHRFLTPDGWKPVRHLSTGEPLATNGLPSVGFDRDDLESKYHKDNRTLEQIAASYNCSPHTVRKWLKKFGLQKQQGMGMTGRKPWNKGKNYVSGWHHTEETIRALSEQKRGEKNPQWMGDAASAQAGRQRAQKLFPQRPCEACGVVEGHRHHKDRNTLNNVEINIEFLCAYCHQNRHIEEDGPTNRLKVRWIAIASIKPDGKEQTYDIEVDHPSHNFVANGFVTHNSQLSQRYVDESIAEYVEPDCIAEDPELHAIWLRGIGQAHEAYLELSAALVEKMAKVPDRCKCGGELAQEWVTYSSFGFVCKVCRKPLKLLTDTERRKAARQAARSVLPNATETKIFVTANARALRHFLEMRGSRHAEPEIRKLAVAVLGIMQVESPNLFGDYQLVPLADGTSEITTQFRKV